MGMVPPLRVFDAFALPDFDSTGMGELEKVDKITERLWRQAPAPNVRIRRLIWMLRNEFPDDPPTAPEEARNWEDGFAPRPDDYDNSILSVSASSFGLERLTPRVVNLARELVLDVWDDIFGVYVPARGLPSPKDEGMKYLRIFLEAHTRRPWENSEALAQALSVGLMKVLGSAGFVQVQQTEQTVRLERRVSNGVQSVTAGIYGPAKSLHCRIFIDQRSPDVQGAILDTALSALRAEHEPAWREAATGAPFVNLAITPFWLAWMLEDLERWGLPLLLRTDEPVAASRTPTATVLSLVPTDDAPSQDLHLLELLSRAKAGDVPAMLEAAVKYLDGETVAYDPKAAEDLLLQAVGEGSSLAMFNLGVMFSKGVGRPADMKEALVWFAQAADMGHGPAIHALGRAFRKGIGVAQDVALSNALMAIAHQKGVAEAGLEGIVAGVGAWAQLSEPLLEPGGFSRTLDQRLLNSAKLASGPAHLGEPRAGSSGAAPTNEPSSVGGSPLARAGWGFFLGPLLGLLATGLGAPDYVAMTTVLVGMVYVAWQLFQVGGQSWLRFVLPLTVLYPPLALLVIIVLGLRRI